MVTFDEDGQEEKALSRFNNYVMGIKFKIFRWKPNFDFTQDFNITLIWIQVPNIGMVYLS